MTTSPVRLLCALCLVFLQLDSAPAFGVCEPDSPARPVPQFDPDLAPGVSLWPIDPVTSEIMLKPAEVPLGVTRSGVNGHVLHPDRDSTDYLTQSIPGLFSGHELFQDVAVPGRRSQSATQSDWLFVAYSGGISVWNLQNDPEDPPKVATADGWPHPFGPGDWAAFPNGGEGENFVRALDVIQEGSLYHIAVAGEEGAGVAIWTFNPSTTQLTQNYQDPHNIESYDISMVKDPNGRIYAFAAEQGVVGTNGGVKVYDVTEAVSGALCVEPTGSYTCGVYEGMVGSLTDRAQFVSAIVANGETYVAASDGKQSGGNLRLEIWEVANPENPGATPGGASVQRFNGLDTRVWAPELFAYDGVTYIALVERVGGSPNPEQMRIHDIDHCLDSGCASLGTAKATETVKFHDDRHFLDLSFSNGAPFLHLGNTSTGLFGSGFERLWDLGQLPATAAPNLLPEITDTGGSYNDPCDNALVDYFGDYYINNEYGLRHFSPRHAIFTGSYLYRAGKSVLDVHVRGGEAQTNDPSIIPRLQSGGSINSDTFWMDETVMLEADVLNCLAGGVDWCWAASLSNPNVDAFPVPASPDGCDPTFDDVHSMTFLCQDSGRCADTSVTVAAWNESTSCVNTGLEPQDVGFNLKDPEVDAVLLDSGGTSFPECQQVSLEASVEGRGSIEWAWLVDGESISGCSGTVPSGTDLSTESFACDWDTAGLTFDLIFGDDFDDGTCDAWSSGCPATFKSGVVQRAAAERKGSLSLKAGGTVLVEFEVSEVAGPVLDTLSEAITFNPVGDPAFSGPLPDPVVNGAGALLQAPATDTTTWTWEIEDPDSPGAPCSFNASKNCVTEDTPVDNIEYLWDNAGTYIYEVSLSNCSSAGSVSASGSATVSDAAAPVIVDFDISASSILSLTNPEGVCTKDVFGNCGPAGTIYCPTGVPIDFDLVVQEEGSFNFLFDWERASTGDVPSFVADTPSSQAGVEYVFTHTFSGAAPSPNFPIAQVQFGNTFELDDLLEFGTCG